MWFHLYGTGRLIRRVVRVKGCWGRGKRELVPNRYSFRFDKWNAF